MSRHRFTKKIRTYQALEVGEYVMPINTMAPWNLPARVVEIRHTDADRFGHAVVIEHLDGERNQTYSNYLRKIPEREAFKMILKSTDHA